MRTMTRWERFLDFFGCKPGGVALSPMSISAESRCVRCGRRILMDSQGGWFPVGEINNVMELPKRRTRA